MKTINYEQLTYDALNKPGMLSDCFKTFYNYSTPNRWLAITQLGAAQPINTYRGWQALGRQVKRGSKAIALRMPVTIKDKETGDIEGMAFIFRNNWFGLHQTDGAEYAAPLPPIFNIDIALRELGITKEPFNYMDGNAMGYAKPNKDIIAINPIDPSPFKTIIHELAHCLLHKNDALLNNTLTADVRELEAELTAYIVTATLCPDMDLSDSRGYIQNWMRDNTKEKLRYSAVYSAVDKIIKAGTKAE